MTVLQVTQALGGHLQVRETPDQKGRGVFATQVIILLVNHRTEHLLGALPKDEAH